MTPERKAELIALSQSHVPTDAPITSRSFDSFTPRQQRAMKRAMQSYPVTVVTVVACLDCGAGYIPTAGDTAFICAECMARALRALLPSDVDGYLAAVRSLPEAQVATVAACWPSAIHYSPLSMWQMLRDVDQVAGF